MNNLKKRCLTLLLSLAMIVTYMPTSMIAYAVDQPEQPEVETTEPAEEVTSEDAVTEATAAEDGTSEEVASPEAVEKPAETPKAADEVKDKSEEKTLVWDKGAYEVTVSYGEDAKIPEGSKLVLTEFGKKDKEYKDAKAALIADEDGNSAFSQATKEEQKNLGMAAFDLTIYDKDGNVVEPKDKVGVSIKLNELPEGVDAKTLADSMEIQHLNESSGDVVVEKIATADSQEAKKDDAVGEIAVNETKETAEVETVVEGFSTYTVTWRYYGQNYSQDIHYVDESGNSLTPSQTPSYTSSTNYLIYDIPGYEFVSAHLGSRTGTEIAPWLGVYDNFKYYYNTSGGTGYLSDDIYMVYKKRATPTTGGSPTLKPVGEGDKPAAPTVLKESEPNGDGTADLSLSITGHTKDREVEKLADVIVIMDVSGSMNYQLGSDTNGTSNYNSRTGKWTGTCRLDNAKNAVNSLVDSLAERKDSQGNPLVRMSLINFSNTAGSSIGLTNLDSTGVASYKAAVNGLSANGGTNWEAALKMANEQSVDSGRATFVIFVTDGDPTFRLTRYNVSDSNLYNQSDIDGDYYRNYGIFGAGSNDDQGRNYNGAVKEGTAITSANKNLYTIGISNSVTKVSNFNTAVSGDGAYLASNADALNQAFTDIQNSIIAKMGVSDVQMTDGITEMTQTVEKSGLTGTDGNFTYWKKGKDDTSFDEWNPASENCAEAEYDEDSGAVKWNMGTNFMPEDGATYKVTWKVWPSQEAYDILAKCENDPSFYDTLTTAQKAQIKRSGSAPNYTYTLKTNEPGAGIKYKDATKTASDITTEGDYYTLPFNEVDDLGLASGTISIKKNWENELDGRDSGTKPIVFKVLAGDEEFGSVTLEYNDDKTKAWRKDDYNISTGLMTTEGGNQVVYEHGHDYTIVEPADLDYYWDFKADVYHPMVINNQTVMLIKVDSAAEADYTIDGKYYKVKEGEALLEATNFRRSNLNLSKTVVDNTGAPVNDQNGEFTFKVTVTESKGEDVWFSVQDASGATVKDQSIASGTGIEYQESDGYFHIPSGNEITLKLKNGWNARFINLHTDSRYSFEESTMTNGYEFVSADPSVNEESDGTPATINNKTATGTVDKTNTSYSVNYKNKQVITSKSVKKEWADTGIVGALNIGAVTVQLIADGILVEGKIATLNAGNEWSATFENLPKFSEKGAEIAYQIVETAVFDRDGKKLSDDYFTSTPTVDPQTGDTTITNTRNKGSLKIVKVIEGDDLFDSIKNKATVTITGPSDFTGTAPVSLSSFTKNADGNYEYTVNNVPTGEYSITEANADVTGYDLETSITPEKVTVEKDATQVATLTVTNTYTVHKTEAEVTKVWSDDSNRDNKRPASVTFQLYKTVGNTTTAVTGKTVTINAADQTGNEWKDTITDLPEYEDGSKITYSFKELKADGTVVEDGGKLDDNYTATYNSGVKVTNSYSPETTSVSVEKVWADDNNRDNIRPTSVRVVLKADGKAVTQEGIVAEQVLSGNNLTYTWTGLNKNDGGEAIEYTVDEVSVPSGYEKKVEANTAKTSYTITNTHTPEKTHVPAQKIWKGTEENSITFVLYAGEGAKKTEVARQTVNKNDDGEWKYDFTNLNKNENGVPIVYTVEETGVDSTKYDSATSGNATSGFVFTNTNKEKTEVPFTKTWVGPKKDITINLLRDGEIVDSKSFKGTEENFSGKFENLPKYDSNQIGHEYAYTISETMSDADKNNYSTEITGDAATGYTIKNTNTEKINVPVEKIWDDDNDRDRVRPESVTVQLKNKGENVGEAVTLDAGKEWKHTWTGLNKYNADGTEAEYTVVESEVQNYTTTYEGDYKAGLKVKNSYTPGKTSVSVTKVWKDDDNRDNIRPTEITVKLLANGKEVTQSGIEKQVVLKGDNEWTYTWTGLNLKEAGANIAYTVEEVNVPRDYTAAVTGDQAKGYTVTNTHVPVKTTVSVEKIWDDDNNRDNIRPATLDVKLMADGAEVDQEGIEPVVTLKDGVWTYTWTGLNKLNKGKDIVYTVDEVAVPEGYTKTKVEGDYKTGFKITNTHVNETTTVSVEKVWVDDEDRDNIRPARLEVKLTADGKEVTQSGITPTVTLKDGSWTYTWTGLNKNDKGTPIVYAVDEVSVPEGYTKKVEANDAKTSYTITNTHETAKTRVSVEKVWADDTDRDRLRPDKIEVELKADGKAITQSGITAVQELNADGSWTYTWTGLNKLNKGKEIVYTVDEVSVPEGYTKKVEANDAKTSYTITNTHEPAKTEASVLKVWDDNNNQDGYRPQNVKVVLKANGNVVDQDGIVAEQTLSESNKWTYKWEGLNENEAGRSIVYTVDEVSVPEKYTKTITGDKATGFTITNSHTPATTEVTVVKIWNDRSDYDKLRPEGIGVHLAAKVGSRNAKLPEGTVKDVTLTKTANVDPQDPNKWTYTWSGLPLREDGALIDYSVSEDPVNGYHDKPSIVGPTATEATAGDPDTTVYKVEITNTLLDVYKEAKAPELTILKKDQDGLAMKDVTFTLTNPDNKETLTGTTGNDGIAKIAIPVSDKWLPDDERDEGKKKEYNFTLTETPVAGYEEIGPWNVKITLKKIDGENTYKYEIVDVEGEDGTTSKAWTRFIEWIISGLTGQPAAAYDWDGENVYLTVTNKAAKQSVQVTKTFAGLKALPEDFAIDVTYVPYGAVKDAEGKIPTTTKHLTAADEGATVEGNKVTWTIDDVRFGSEVTATESGYEEQGYGIESTYTTKIKGGEATAPAQGTTATIAKVPAGAEEGEIVGNIDFTNTYTHINLEINKEIDKLVSYDEGGEVKDATFTFRVIGKDAGGNEVLNTVASVMFNASTKTTSKAVIEKIPANITEITVTEIDSGNYQSAKVKAEEMTEANYTKTWTVSFDNKQKTGDYESGAINRYEKSGTGYVKAGSGGTQNTEGGAGDSGQN